MKNIKLRDNFKYNRTYKIREIALKDIDALCELGVLVKESDYEFYDFGLEEKVVLPSRIYNSYIEPNKAYKIYKELNNPNLQFEDDAALIEQLQKRQENVKLTDFPTGVVTLNGRVIGQEMPYYKGITLEEYAKTTKEKNASEILKKIKCILEELYKNGIVYLDVNEGNFIIDNNKNVHLIDYDAQYIKFYCNEIQLLKVMRNYNDMLQNLSKYLEIVEEDIYKDECDFSKILLRK